MSQLPNKFFSSQVKMSNKKYNLIFFGTAAFGLPILQKLVKLPYLELKAVITQPDKPVGRKQILTPPPVKTLAKKFNIPVLQPDNIRTEEFEEKIRQINPKLVILVAYGKIIPKNVLEIPKFGWLNIHASLLPKFRGASPIQSAILSGEKETGVTLMKIDEHTDTGPIITQEKIEIAPDETSQTLHDKLSRLGAELLAKTLPFYLDGKIKPKPQNNSQATYTKIIKKEDGKIDWQKSAEEIERQIRAFMPWPGVFCFWPKNDRSEQKELTNSPIEMRLKIIEASVAKDVTKLPPGQTKKTNHTAIVGCAHGNLELKKIQLEGKKIQTIADFLKGYPKFGQTKFS